MSRQTRSHTKDSFTASIADTSMRLEKRNGRLLKLELLRCGVVCRSLSTMEANGLPVRLCRQIVSVNVIATLRTLARSLSVKLARLPLLRCLHRNSPWKVVNRLGWQNAKEVVLITNQARFSRLT